MSSRPDTGCAGLSWTGAAAGARVALRAWPDDADCLRDRCCCEVFRGGAAVGVRVVLVVIKRIPFGGGPANGCAEISAVRRRGNTYVRDTGGGREPAFTTLVSEPLYAWTWT